MLQKPASLRRPAQKQRRPGTPIAVEQELAESYGILGTPTFVMFRNGVEVGRAEGPNPTFANVLAVIKQPFES